MSSDKESLPNENYIVNEPYLTYTISGGIVGYSLKLDIYKNGNYVLFDKGVYKLKGHLDVNQIKIINDVVGTINKINEKDKPIDGSDILYETLTTKNNSVSMNIYEKYKNSDKEIQLLNAMMRL